LIDLGATAPKIYSLPANWLRVLLGFLDLFLLLRSTESLWEQRRENAQDNESRNELKPRQLPSVPRRCCEV